MTKFLIIVLMLTLLASFYVYQQSQIVQLAYREQENLADFKSLVDQNNNLKYGINRRTSLVSMAKIWLNGDFEWPHREQIASLPAAREAIKENQDIPQADSIFTHLFELKSQAEATPVKPR
ncbi:MAG: hypothetical protein ABIC18_05600 [Candidatus Omnitrophota bacterium]